MKDDRRCDAGAGPAAKGGERTSLDHREALQSARKLS